MSFLWCTAHVKNLQESIDFYETYVGIKVTRRFDSGQGMEIAFLGDGETQLELIASVHDGDLQGTDQISIGFSVESLDKKIDELAQGGIELYREPVQPNPHIRFCYVKDPNGISVQFVEQM